MSASEAESPEVDQNLPTYVSQVSMVVQGSVYSQAGRNLAQVLSQVPTNIFMGALQGNLGFVTAHIMILVKNGYDT